MRVTIPKNDPGFGELGGPKRPPQPYRPADPIGPDNPLGPGGGGGGGGGEGESSKKKGGNEYLMVIGMITVGVIAFAVGYWIAMQPAVQALADDVLEALGADRARE